MRLLKNTNDRLRIEDLMGPDRELILAKLIQNALHPKNMQRADAIKLGKYNHILTAGDGQAYLNHMLESHFDMELMTIERKLRKAREKAKGPEAREGETDLEREIARLVSGGICNGNGGRNNWVNDFCSMEPSYWKDVVVLVKILADGHYYGQSIYCDGWKEPETRMAKKPVFKLWLHLCRRHKAIHIE